MVYGGETSNERWEDGRSKRQRAVQQAGCSTSMLMNSSSKSTEIIGLIVCAAQVRRLSSWRTMPMMCWSARAENLLRS